MYLYAQKKNNARECYFRLRAVVKKNCARGDVRVSTSSAHLRNPEILIGSIFQATRWSRNDITMRVFQKLQFLNVLKKKLIIEIIL